MATHKKIRTYTATELDLEMLEAVARYHGFSKSATITSLIKKEFWRLFPGGNRAVRPDRGARVVERQVAGGRAEATSGRAEAGGRATGASSRPSRPAGEKRS